MLLWFSAILFSLLSASLALSPHFLKCQTQKPLGHSPLLGCPLGTIFVSHNTSDVYAHFHSVQEAVLSLYVLHISYFIVVLKFLSDETKPAIILIAEGEYYETVSILRPGPLTLLVRHAPPLFMQCLLILTI